MTIFCTNCGVAGQAGRFCSGCGTALGAAPAPHPTINNKVDVTVNVGGPTLIAGKGTRVVAARPAVMRTPGDEWYLNTAVIIFACFVFFPVGLALVWMNPRWTRDTKWAVSGLVFWPLWIRSVMRQMWPLWVKVTAAAALLVMYGALFTRLAPLAVLLAIPSFIWVLKEANRGKSDTLTGDVRAIAEGTLHECNMVIEDIEGTIGLDLVSTESQLRQRYRDALEIRAEGARLLSEASSGTSVALASSTLADALAQLNATRERLMAFESIHRANA